MSDVANALRAVKQELEGPFRDAVHNHCEQIVKGALNCCPNCSGTTHRLFASDLRWCPMCGTLHGDNWKPKTSTPRLVKESIMHKIPPENPVLRQEIERLYAENQRLREALMAVAEMFTEDEWDADAIRLTVRETLGGRGE